MQNEFKEQSEFQVESLSAATLKDTSEMADQVFNYVASDKPSDSFRASLDENGIQKLYPNIERTEYWIAKGNSEHPIAGVSGLYENANDKHEAAWLGWTCVHPSERGHGLGSAFLTRAIDETRRRGKRFLRLYTSDHPKDADAKRLYESAGFVETGRDPETTAGDGVKCHHIYMQKDLRLEDEDVATLQDRMRNTERADIGHLMPGINPGIEITTASLHAANQEPQSK